MIWDGVASGIFKIGARIYGPGAEKRQSFVCFLFFSLKHANKQSVRTCMPFVRASGLSLIRYSTSTFRRTKEQIKNQTAAFLFFPVTNAQQAARAAPSDGIPKVICSSSGAANFRLRWNLRLGIYNITDCDRLLYLRPYVCQSKRGKKKTLKKIEMKLPLPLSPKKKAVCLQ